MLLRAVAGPAGTGLQGYYRIGILPCRLLLATGPWGTCLCHPWLAGPGGSGRGALGADKNAPPTGARVAAKLAGSKFGVLVILRILLHITVSHLPRPEKLIWYLHGYIHLKYELACPPYVRKACVLGGQYAIWNRFEISINRPDSPDSPHSTIVLTQAKSTSSSVPETATVQTLRYPFQTLKWH